MSVPPDIPASAESADAGSLRARILGAATTLFAERGYDGTSIRAVVETVGCTKPALYYYFASKEALYLSAVQAPLEEFDDLVRTSADGTGPFADRLEALLEGALVRARRQPDAVKLLLSLPHRPMHKVLSSGDNPLATLYQRQMQLLTGLITGAQSKGQIRTDIVAEDLASAIAALTHHYIFVLTVKGQPPPAGAARRIVDLLLHGAAP